MIGSATFDSLTELVQYYESNPLYRRMKLKYAINEEVLKSIGEVSEKKKNRFKVDLSEVVMKARQNIVIPVCFFVW